MTRDLARPEATANVSCIFDFGSSGGSDVARNKVLMIAEAFLTARENLHTPIGRGTRCIVE
jgi:hypothetical protein